MSGLEAQPTMSNRSLYADAAYVSSSKRTSAFNLDDTEVLGQHKAETWALSAIADADTDFDFLAFTWADFFN